MGPAPVDLRAAVVVGGGAPDVDLRRPVEQVDVVNEHPGGQTRAGIEAVDEPVPADGDGLLGRLGPRRRPGAPGAAEEAGGEPVARVRRRQCHLVEAEGMTGREERQVAGEAVGDGQEAAARRRQIREDGARQRNGRCCMGRNRPGKRQGARGEHLAVAGEVEGELGELAQIGEVEIVAHREAAPLEIEIGDPGGALHVPQLLEPRVGDPVG